MNIHTLDDDDDDEEERTEKDDTMTRQRLSQRITRNKNNPMPIINIARRARYNKQVCFERSFRA
jgi:hypothetical protein